MAKIIIPLLSLVASGTVGNLNFYAAKKSSKFNRSAGSHVHIVRRRAKKPTKPATPAQLLVRQKYSAAATAWGLLSPDDKMRWKNAGTSTTMAGKYPETVRVYNGFTLFLREWYIQAGAPGKILLIPAYEV